MDEETTAWLVFFTLTGAIYLAGIVVAYLVSDRRPARLLIWPITLYLKLFHIAARFAFVLVDLYYWYYEYALSGSVTRHPRPADRLRKNLPKYDWLGIVIPLIGGFLVVVLIAIFAYVNLVPMVYILPLFIARLLWDLVLRGMRLPFMDVVRNFLERDS